MIGKQANLIDKRARRFRIIFMRTHTSGLAARDSAFCNNLANVSEIGHLDDPLNEMETHWMENINETISRAMIKRLTWSPRKRAILLKHDNNRRYFQSSLFLSIG